MTKNLKSFAAIHYGQSPSGVFSVGGEYPVIGTGGEFGRSSRSLYPRGIVVPRKGSLGNPQILNEPFWPSDTTFVVIPNSDTDGAWLFYNLLYFDLTRLNEATGVPSINRDRLEKIVLRDTELPIQQKIARILQTVDRAIEKTEALIGKCQQIKAGLMHDLFTRGLWTQEELDRGDHKGTRAEASAKAGQLRPARHDAPHLYQETEIGWIPKAWDCEYLGDHITKIDSGWSPNCDSNPASETEWAILKTTAVVWPGYDPLENKRLPAAYGALPQIEVKTDDILITRKGPVDRVGVVVHCSDTPARRAFPDTVFRTRLNPNSRLSPSFAARMLGCESIQKHWWQRKIGLAEAQVNLNHGILRRTPILIPKTQEEQSTILRMINAALARIATQKSYLAKLKDQKSGLMNDLLTGKVPVTPDS